jgi:hypothetical protein
MATSGVLFQGLVNYYGALSKQTLALMFSTREDLRNGTFDWSKTMSRSVALWLDAAEGWWGALLATASAPLPTLFMSVGPDDSTSDETVQVSIGPGQVPEMSEIAQIGGTAHIAKDAITLDVTRLGDAVELKLRKLKSLRASGTLPSGLYAGIVHLGQKPLAIVMIRIA